MPRGLPQNVKKCLLKAIDSSLLAVETYNKPAIKFKSGCYVILMVIAWTALFHAIFHKKKMKPFYRKACSNRYQIIEGDYKHWELKTCIENYFLADTQNPIRKNLEFFIRIRNRIEHRSLPEIDANIFGECQAMLLNFDQLVEKEFGIKYCIRESLSFSLQLFPSRESLNSALKSNSATKDLISFIESYRSSISSEIMDSGNYSFKAFLIQVANHQSADVLPIQFLQYDKLSEEEKTFTKRIVAMVKYKQGEGAVINDNLLKPLEVVRRVQSGLGDLKVERKGEKVDYFNMHAHSLYWKKLQVRPESKSKTPNKTKKEFCIYDKAHEDYLYQGRMGPIFN
jgi:hypothetical protein